MVENQIGNMTPNPSFGHNFQDLFNDIRNSLIQWVLAPEIALQSGSSLENVEVHSLTLSHIPRSIKCDSLHSQSAYTFASPCRGRKPKAKVVTIIDLCSINEKWLRNRF